jgi:hypothetical protein
VNTTPQARRQRPPDDTLDAPVTQTDEQLTVDDGIGGSAHRRYKTPREPDDDSKKTHSNPPTPRDIETAGDEFDVMLGLRVSEQKDCSLTPPSRRQRPREYAHDDAIDEDFAPIARTNNRASILKQTSPHGEPGQLSQLLALESRAAYDFEEQREQEPALMAIQPLSEYELREQLLLLTSGSSEEEEGVAQQCFSPSGRV